MCNIKSKCLHHQALIHLWQRTRSVYGMKCVDICLIFSIIFNNFCWQLCKSQHQKSINNRSIHGHWHRSWARWGNRGTEQDTNMSMHSSFSFVTAFVHMLLWHVIHCNCLFNWVWQCLNSGYTVLSNCERVFPEQFYFSTFGLRLSELFNGSMLLSTQSYAWPAIYKTTFNIIGHFRHKAFRSSLVQ